LNHSDDIRQGQSPDTAMPYWAGPGSGKQVNSDPRVMREEEGILQISGCAC
jgi:hypothetical protein